MAIDRRSLLAGLVVTAGIGPRAARAAEVELFAAARKGRDGRFAAAIFDDAGQDVRVVDLPERGHDVTVSPVSRTCVVFARRPGNFALAFSPELSRPPVAFTTPTDRHFYGHGVFSRDGRLLYATENDFEAGRGVIGVYDATGGFNRIGEMPTYGVGPHDIALMGRQSILVVANGGLREHPDFGEGRRVLNPGEIATSLAYIDARTGGLLERHDLGLPGTLSLRHLDLARDGTVILGAQVEGSSAAHPLVFRHRRQQPLQRIGVPDDAAAALCGYVSSVAVDRGGEIAAVSSSRGAIVLMIEVTSGRVAGRVMLKDVSGIAPAGADGCFVVTSGTGVVAGTGARGDTLSERALLPVAWDNHAVRL